MPIGRRGDRSSGSGGNGFLSPSPVFDPSHGLVRATEPARAASTRHVLGSDRRRRANRSPPAPGWGAGGDVGHWSWRRKLATCRGCASRPPLHLAPSPPQRGCSCDGMREFCRVVAPVEHHLLRRESEALGDVHRAHQLVVSPGRRVSRVRRSFRFRHGAASLSLAPGSGASPPVPAATPATATGRRDHGPLPRRRCGRAVPTAPATEEEVRLSASALGPPVRARASACVRCPPPPPRGATSRRSSGRPARPSPAGRRPGARPRPSAGCRPW